MFIDKVIIDVAAGDVGGGNEAAWDGTLNVGEAAG